VFSVRRDRVRSPRTGQPHDVTVLVAPDWVNVVAVTAKREIVLVRQFRHGTGKTTLEIPGGAVDPSDRSPLAAARRELREETGYAARRWRRIGVVDPNPAFQTNACTTFLAEGAFPAGASDPDEGEDLEVVLVSRTRLRALLRGGVIRHALVVAALKWWEIRGGS
jgi:ADP-ribose pyrophosphatase